MEDIQGHIISVTIWDHVFIGKKGKGSQQQSQKSGAADSQSAGAAGSATGNAELAKRLTAQVEAQVCLPIS